jgi:hypothetical protein
LNYIRSNTTLMIGPEQQFPSLQDAWGFALEARIADGAYLHFAISTVHGELLDIFSSSFSLDHAFGGKISISGDNPSKIFLGGSQGFYGNGFTIDSGHDLALLSGVTMVGQGTLGQGSGITATTNASINCVGVQIFFFENGVWATTGASVTLDSTSTIAASTYNTVYASQNANVSLTGGFTCTDTSGNEILYATSGGNISAVGCSLTGGGSNSGVASEDGGSIDISDGTLTNFVYGIRCEDHSFVNAAYETFTSDTTDVLIDWNGVVNAQGVTGLTKNTDSGTGSYVYGEQ